MSARLLDGDALAARFKEEIAEEIGVLKAKGTPPLLTAVQATDNPGSRIYVRNQKRACEEMGIAYQLRELSTSASENEIRQVLQDLNEDPAVTGIILQMPLPQGVNPRRLQRAIAQEKDAEGMHPANMGLLVYGEPRIAPCTAMGAVELFKTAGVPLKGLEAVIVGHSEIVGKPLNLLLLQSLTDSATPTVCHIATQDLARHTRRADLLFVAAGKPELIRGDMIKDGAIVVDIGINRVPCLDGSGQKILDDKGKPKMKVVGDVVFEEAKERASFLSPVPGGVGPLTVVMLMKNTLACARWQAEN